jgi:hypothetical protein
VGFRWCFGGEARVHGCMQNGVIRMVWRAGLQEVAWKDEG